MQVQVLPSAPTILGLVVIMAARLICIQRVGVRFPAGPPIFTRTWYSGCAAVSKTALSRFDSGRPCHFSRGVSSVG